MYYENLRKKTEYHIAIHSLEVYPIVQEWPCGRILRNYMNQSIPAVKGHFVATQVHVLVLEDREDLSEEVL